MNLLEEIKLKAKSHNKRIVLPEGLEERTLKAADEIIREGIAQIILLGNPDAIKAAAEKFNLTSIINASIVDPADHERKGLYIDLMVELRKHKGLTAEEAAMLIEDPLYLGTLMIKNGDADGEVAGAMNATGDVLRPAFQYVKTLPGISVDFRPTHAALDHFNADTNLDLVVTLISSQVAVFLGRGDGAFEDDVDAAHAVERVLGGALDDGEVRPVSVPPPRGLYELGAHVDPGVVDVVAPVEKGVHLGDPAADVDDPDRAVRDLAGESVEDPERVLVSERVEPPDDRLSALRLLVVGESCRLIGQGASPFGRPRRGIAAGAGGVAQP